MHPPKSLTAVQTWFASIITRPLQNSASQDFPAYDPKLTGEIEEKITSSPLLSAPQCLGIYHQQYWWRLLHLMQEFYPSLLRLFSHADFNALIAEPYLLCHPPADWFLPNLALHLPQWLEEHYREKDKNIVLPLARLDEAHESLWHAPTHPPLDASFHDRPISLQPFVTLFEQPADFLSFREQLLAHAPDHWQKNQFPDLIATPTAFALYRGSGGIQYMPLEKEEFSLLSSFQRPTLLETALAPLTDDSAVIHWFQKWTSLGWLTQQPKIT